MTNTTATPEIRDFAGMTVDLGDGNWEITAENGVWTITADEAEITPDTCFHIEGPNHHFAETWADTLTDALELVDMLGRDGRGARQIRKAHSLDLATTHPVLTATI